MNYPALMQVGEGYDEAVEIENRAFRGAADIGWIMIALFRREMQRCRFIGEQAADEALPVLDDPAATPVAADGEAGGCR